MDHLGQITIVLGDYSSLPDDFEKLFNDGDSALNSIFKISLAQKKIHSSKYNCEIVSYTASKIVEIKRGKKIAERSRKEIVGASLEEFMNSDRYETFIKRSPHVLVFKMIFDNPWKVSLHHTDVL